jgi:hypothetical protein
MHQPPVVAASLPYYDSNGSVVVYHHQQQQQQQSTGVSGTVPSTNDWFDFNLGNGGVCDYEIGISIVFSV